MPANNVRPIRCVETGRVYPSATAAAEAMGVHRSSMYDCANGMTDTCAGYHWVYIGEEHLVRPSEPDQPKKPDKPRSRPNMTITEVQEEAARRTRETGRRVRYAHIQIEETVALIRQRDKLAKLKRERKAKR